MRHGSWLVNVARGSLVDTDALLTALRGHWIGGAALDVFDTEPLPDDHPLWREPRALLTPTRPTPKSCSLARLAQRVQRNTELSWPARNSKVWWIPLQGTKMPGRVEAFLEHEAEWDKLLAVTDELIDLALNYRQSGHPGGSRSKVHILLSTMMSGAMRWDLLRPWRPLQDRFVLSAGHTVPAVYATLAALNETMKARFERDGDARFALPDDGRWALLGPDLLTLRRRGGLPGHAEMEGKTLFLKFNTGPSGHGMPPAAGEALALLRAGAGEVRVFCLEGEGGLTAGAAHETKNSAWGLGLNNLVFLLDWNDYGIDARAHSSVVAGTPHDWFPRLPAGGSWAPTAEWSGHPPSRPSWMLSRAAPTCQQRRGSAPRRVAATARSTPARTARHGP